MKKTIKAKAIRARKAVAPAKPSARRKGPEPLFGMDPALQILLALAGSSR